MPHAPRALPTLALAAAAAAACGPIVDVEPPPPPSYPGATCVDVGEVFRATYDEFINLSGVSKTWKTLPIDPSSNDITDALKHEFDITLATSLPMTAAATLVVPGTQGIDARTVLYIPAGTYEV